MLEKTIIQYFDEGLVQHKSISAAVLRLDRLHPVVSGNKIFKLKHYLKTAIDNKKKGIVTFGGAFSNHLVAAAFAAKEQDLHSIGYVRGEAPKIPSHSLLECAQYGMQLVYMSREAFDRIDSSAIAAMHPDYALIPHGGYGRLGMMGAKEIMEIPGVEKFDTVIAACGTGTMAAGLCAGLRTDQQLLLVSVLKNNFSIADEINALLQETETKDPRFTLFFEFHLGGYAKKNPDLFETMNWFYNTHHIPTDFVYTGKMVYAFYALLNAGYFEQGSKVLLIHSGGLQGNRSLKNNALVF